MPDEELLEEGLVDLPPGLGAAGSVEVAEVTDEGLQSSEVGQGQLDRFVELTFMGLKERYFSFDTFHLVAE